MQRKLELNDCLLDQNKEIEIEKIHRSNHVKDKGQRKAAEELRDCSRNRWKVYPWSWKGCWLEIKQLQRDLFHAAQLLHGNVYMFFLGFAGRTRHQAPDSFCETTLRIYAVQVFKNVLRHRKHQTGHSPPRQRVLRQRFQ